jgi:hypothetical protein
VNSVRTQFIMRTMESWPGQHGLHVGLCRVKVGWAWLGRLGVKKERADRASQSFQPKEI